MSLLGADVGYGKPNRPVDVLSVQRLINHYIAVGAFQDCDTPVLLEEDGRFGSKTAGAMRACVGTETIERNDRTVGRLLSPISGDFRNHTGAIVGLVMISAKPQTLRRFIVPICLTMDKYGISDRALRIAHFLSQIAHETAELRYVEEIASGQDYEGRRDLGNVNPGDGPRYKGRGLIQLTGRTNYKAYGESVGFDFEGSPYRLAASDIYCADVAGWYWSQRGLNALADLDKAREITKKINGGYNGLESRMAYLNRAKSVLMID